MKPLVLHLPDSVRDALCADLEKAVPQMPARIERGQQELARKIVIDHFTRHAPCAGQRLR